MRILTGLAVLATSICVLGASGAAAVAGEPSREQYVRSAEAICKPVFRQTQPLFRRGDKLIDRGRENAGADLFIRGWRIANEATREQLRPLAPPPDDARSIDRWLDLEVEAATTLIRAWGLFKDGRYERAVRVGERGERIHEQAHRAVKGFGFRFCA